MDKYTIKTSFKMGEPHDTYGQSWYATVEEMAFPIMFNLMGGQTVQEQDRITYEEQTVEHFKSGKNVGKEYRRLKKVKVQEALPRIVEEEVGPKNQTKAEDGDLEARIIKLEEAVFGDIPPEFK